MVGLLPGHDANAAAWHVPIAVARKLAVILHRMWVDGSEFRWGAPRRPGSQQETFQFPPRGRAASWGRWAR
jgi:hypothetical protein